MISYMEGSVFLYFTMLFDGVIDGVESTVANTFAWVGTTDDVVLIVLAKAAGDFNVIFAAHVLQSNAMLALLQSRTNTPDPCAVSLHCAVGVP